MSDGRPVRHVWTEGSGAVSCELGDPEQLYFCLLLPLCRTHSLTRSPNYWCPLRVGDCCLFCAHGPPANLTGGTYPSTGRVKDVVVPVSTKSV